MVFKSSMWSTPFFAKQLSTVDPSDTYIKICGESLFEILKTQVVRCSHIISKALILVAMPQQEVTEKSRKYEETHVKWSDRRFVPSEV